MDQPDECNEKHNSNSDNSSDFEEPDAGNEGIERSNKQDEDDESLDLAATNQPSSSSSSNVASQSSGRSHKSRKFLPQGLSLHLTRNITALADPHKHAPKQDCLSAAEQELFSNWLPNALVSISPGAEIILFGSHVPEPVAFFSKLRPDSTNHYVTKTLDIPLDHNEHITSLLCLPIMSSQRTSLGLVDWTALLVGLSSGYLKFYTEQSVCLLSLRLSSEPLIGIKCQTLKINTNARSQVHFPNLVDELLVNFATSSVVIDGLSLYENLRIAYSEVVRSKTNYEPAYQLTNLPSILNCQQWKFDKHKGLQVHDSELLGQRCTSTFDLLRTGSINFEHNPIKGYGKAIAVVGREPFAASYYETKEPAEHSYTEMIGSLFSMWNKKTQPSQMRMNESSNFCQCSFLDRDRIATEAIASPDKRLVAITDSFGRVMLMDATNSIIIRMWKGYRSAQCGWIEVKRNPNDPNSPYATFLVIYAPKRGLLEVWSAQRGPRVVAFNVGKNCRLLYARYKMLNMRAENIDNNSQRQRVMKQSYSSHCYLLNASSETIFSIELPYTYSLYKFGDLKSRDQLIIGELIDNIYQEVAVISEILNRLALVESLEICIHKISHTLSPDKITLIMENIIINTMKNYDNLTDQTISDEDLSIIELSKRIMKLCSTYLELSDAPPNDTWLPEVSRNLITQYKEYPKELDEFSEQLGWPIPEILRYLSLQTLEQSYTPPGSTNLWPSLGEPLSWIEFLKCFDISRSSHKSIESQKRLRSSDILPIKLKQLEAEFLDSEDIKKTCIFMYGRFSESYYKSKSTNLSTAKAPDNVFRFLEPSSRLVLLTQFWLTTKLCNHWEMWSFFQSQVGQISDELKSIVSETGDEKVLVESWKRVYELILDSANIFGAIIATAAFRSDTLRTIEDDERRMKLEVREGEKEDEESKRSATDWESLCIDAERMSLLSQQLENIFLLSLLLRYSQEAGHLVESYHYKIAKISLAGIFRAGPSIVSELVAQWVVQSRICLRLLKEPYGGNQLPSREDAEGSIQAAATTSPATRLLATLALNQSNRQQQQEEQLKELLHHTRTTFPLSLEPDKIFLNCVWELCRLWTTSRRSGRACGSPDRADLLGRAVSCLNELSKGELRHRLACLAFKTFFQRTFERLSVLVETNSTVINMKNSRLCDALTRKELDMDEECVKEFVDFCCELSEMMLETFKSLHDAHDAGSISDPEVRSKLLAHDRWWMTPPIVRIFAGPLQPGADPHNPVRDFSTTGQSSSPEVSGGSSLVETTLYLKNQLDSDYLVELNSMANLLRLIFKLKIPKAYPISLLDEESRRILQLDAQQPYSSSLGASGGGSSSRGGGNNRLLSLVESRQRFVRKCILAIVSRLAEEHNEFDEEDDEDEDVDAGKSLAADELPPTSGTRKPYQQQQVGGIFISALSSFKMNKPVTRSSAGTTHNGRDTTSLLAAASDKSRQNVAQYDDEQADTTVAGCNLDEPSEREQVAEENNESLILFANLFSMASEWKLEREEIYLELVFELYRCNLDKLARQLSIRVVDGQETLASGLLKICSQRVLLLYGLSPHLSGPNWRRNADAWTVFAPHVANWLRSIQQEEMRREIAALSFSESVRPLHSLRVDSDESNEVNGATLPSHVLRALRQRTRMALESITNHLSGQAARLAYDLLQVLSGGQTGA